MKAESSDLIPLKSNQEVVGYTSKQSIASRGRQWEIHAGMNVRKRRRERKKKKKKMRPPSP